jgi:uncharacterized membrane protein
MPSTVLPVLLLAAALLCAPAARAADDDPHLPARILALFNEKCTSCHSPQTRKGKQFKYINDLPRVVANPKLIVKGDPSRSEIWKVVSKDEMPPEDSDITPLSAAQKDLLKHWIASGAPTGVTPAPPRTDFPPPTASQPSMTTAPSEGLTERRGKSFVSRLVIWLGKFHPLAAHTPIAVLMAAAIAEMLYLKYPSPALTGAARFCAVLGAIGAVVTAALGWAMASTHTSSDLLETHRQLGTIAGIVVIPIALFGEWGARRAGRDPAAPDWTGPSRWVFRLMIFAIAAFIGFTAHMGGALHWGEDFFNFPNP